MVRGAGFRPARAERPLRPAPRYRDGRGPRAWPKSLGVVRHVEIDVDLSAFGGSSLTSDAPVPKDRDIDHADIPSTYVPARNTVFLSLALGWAEVLGARDLVIGVNALDYSGYPGLPPGVHRGLRAPGVAGDARRA